ncbi:hypothetical protein BLOT_004673 [Blomia tropicalis]|nr:hypothetical protein BLOT_004673 [Blomia tropicalis]
MNIILNFIKWTGRPTTNSVAITFQCIMSHNVFGFFCSSSIGDASDFTKASIVFGERIDGVRVGINGVKPVLTSRQFSNSEDEGVCNAFELAIEVNGSFDELGLNELFNGNGRVFGLLRLIFVKLLLHPINGFGSLWIDVVDKI